MPTTLLERPPLNPTHEPFPIAEVTEPHPPRRHKIIAVLPAYNAEKTLAATLADFPAGCVDEVLLVDDVSRDRTVEIARKMGLTVIVHAQNKGYGGNQKTCYQYCLERGADIVVMIHPDYQYDARVIPHAVSFIELGICDVVLGNRIRSRPKPWRAGCRGGSIWRIGHSPCSRTRPSGRTSASSTRASASTAGRCSKPIPFERNSDDFVFDTQFLVQAVHHGFRLGDVPVPVRYFSEASSINFKRSTKYGLQTVRTVGQWWLHRLGIRRSELFGRK